MNNDNEIVKQFNENITNNPEVTVDPYRVTQNQNNFIQSHEIDNMNTAVLNNDENVIMPNFINTNQTINMVPEVNNTANINNSNNSDIINNLENGNINSEQNFVQTDNVQQLYDTTSYINDSNKTIEKKPKKASVKINPELKSIVIIAIVLLVAMAFIPTIFDIYDSLRIKIFG